MAPHIQLTQVHMKRGMLTSCTFEHWTEDKAYVILVLNVTYHHQYQKEDSNYFEI